MDKRLILLTLALVLTLAFSLFAEEESLTITTYYPSPYGSYNELRLYPHSPPVTPCDDTSRGTMYYNSVEDLVYVCKGVGKGWQPMAPIPAGMIAMFTNACPAGWTRFTPLDNNFPRGSATYDGVSRGYASHSHSYTGTTARPIGQGFGIMPGLETAGKQPIPSSDPTHTHAYSGTTDSSSSLPPYLDVIWCQKG